MSDFDAYTKRNKKAASMAAELEAAQDTIKKLTIELECWKCTAESYLRKWTHDSVNTVIAEERDLWKRTAERYERRIERLRAAIVRGKSK